MDYKEHITGVFDRSASVYGGFGSHFFDIFADRLLSHVNGFPGASILDVATGRGAILKRAVLIIGKEGKAVGIDISPKMIEETKREIQAPNVSLFCMDAEELAFEDHSFDIVTCGFALFFFPDTKKALQEFRRVLKPGGKIATSTWNKMGMAREVLKEKLRSAGADPEFTAHPMPSAKELDILFKENGFSSVQIVPDKLEHLYANFDHWWECLWKRGSRSALEKLSEKELGLIQSELTQELESVNRPDGFHEELEVFYTIASA